jgi:hypothetical protein
MFNRMKWFVGGVTTLVLGGSIATVARAEHEEGGEDAETLQKNDLPAPVLQAVNQQLPGATVQNVETLAGGERTVFEVHSVQNGKSTETYFDEDGKLLGSRDFSKGSAEHE